MLLRFQVIHRVELKNAIKKEKQYNVVKQIAFIEKMENAKKLVDYILLLIN